MSAIAASKVSTPNIFALSSKKARLGDSDIEMWGIGVLILNWTVAHDPSMYPFRMKVFISLKVVQCFTRPPRAVTWWPHSWRSRWRSVG